MSDNTLRIQNVDQIEASSPLNENYASPTRLPLIRDFSEEQYSPASHINLIRQDTPDDKLLVSGHSSVDTLKSLSKKRTSLNVRSRSPATQPRRASKFKEGADASPRKSPALMKQNSLSKPHLRKSPTLVFKDKDKPRRRSFRHRSTKDLPDQSNASKSYSEIEELQHLYHHKLKDEDSTSNILADMSPVSDYNKKISVKSRVKQMYYQMLRKKLTRSGTQAFTDTTEFVSQIQEIKDNVRTPNDERVRDLVIVDQTPLEKLEVYTDNYPLLKSRKTLMRIQRTINLIASKIIKHPIFEYFILGVIVLNSVVLALDDPTTSGNDIPGIDNVLLGIYTAECVLKILGMGFLFNEGAYIRDMWNILDFVIVVTGYIPLLLSSDGLNLQAFRALRVLRPLKTISKIEELRLLIGTLVGAFGPLLETLAILMFVYLIFAIAGLQLFTGQLLYRCFDLETGVPVEDDTEPSTKYQMLCIDSTSCPSNAICGKMVNNPNYDITNFDTLQHSFLMVFQIVTQEGWSDIMYFMDKSFTPYASIYFILLIVVCGFFLLNLTLAVLKVKFTENTAQEVKAKDLNEKYWVHGEKYFDKLEYNKREVLRLMEKRRTGEIEFNKYEMKKDNLIAVDVDKAHKFRAGVSRKKRRADSNKVVNWLQKSVDKIKRRLPGTQSFSNLVSMVKRSISTKRSSSISPADGTLAKSQSIKKIELMKMSNPKILITAKTKSLKEPENKGELLNVQFATESVTTERLDLNSTSKPLLRSNSPPYSAQLQKDSSSQIRPMDSSRLMTALTPEKSPIKAEDSPHQPNGTPSLVIIPSIAEANEHLENSFHGVTSKNFLSIQRNNFMSSSLKVSSPIRPLLAEKVEVKANGGEKASLINIAGIRNKDDQNQKVRASAKGTYVFDATPVPGSKEVSFNANDEQSVLDLLDAKSPIGQMGKPKTAKHQNRILHKINQISNPKHIKPRKSRLSVQPRLSALTSTFDLGEGAVIDHEVDGFVPTGILDDSDFLDEEQRRELIRRKRQETAIRRKLNGGRSPTKRTTRNITSFGHLHRGDSHTYVGGKKLTRSSLEGDRSSMMHNKLHEEDEDDERFVIDVRYLKAIPAFERDYDATCENDVLPSKKEREERAQEEKEIESLKKSRLKLEFKITTLDEKRAKDRMESYYSRSSGYASIMGSSQRSKRQKTEESMADVHESKSVHEKDFETTNSKQTLNRKASKLSKKKTFNPTSMSATESKKGGTTLVGRNAANNNNDEDYIKPEKMNDFLEILNRIEKPFPNEAGLDNPQVQDEKLKEFKFQEEYRAIRKNDLETYKVGEKNWSGDNVLQHSNANFAVHRVKIALNKQDFDRWRPGYMGVFHELRRACRALIESSIFNNFVLVAVILNTVLLATQGLVSDSATTLLNNFNLTFTIIFTIELVVKMTGLGVTGYVSDNMNLFDAAIVIISLVEAIFFSGSTSAVSALRSIRLLRTFRVLRVTKLLRTLKYMQIIISVLSRSLKKFFYIFVLLFLFLFIYTLLGMQLFGGGLNLDDNVGANRVRQNFDSFGDGFMAAFQIMTMENWTDIAFLAIRSKSVSTIISIFYFISWIWIGNYILLNLFLAILLDEFTGDEITNEYEELEIEDDGSGSFSSRGHTFDRSTKQGTGTQKTLSKDSGGQKSVSSNSKADADFGDDDEASRQIKNHKTEIRICEKSLYIFTKQNPIRKVCLKIIQHRYFERAIMVMIVFSSVKLAFDTYYDDDTTNSVIKVSNKIDYGINIFFALEASLKIISLGLFVDEGCYLRETWNQLDIIIVVASILDMSIESVNLGFIKILRLLRTLRPLRFITHNKSMRLIVTALLESVGAIFNVVIVTVLIWMMFAILAINIWADKLGYCSLPDSNQLYYHITINNCASDYGGVWTNQDFNFDNIFEGLIALFILSTQENWPNIMFTFEDANDATIGPVEGSMRLFADVYFIVFMFVGTYFLVNLFIGVIFLEFSRAQKREDHLKKFLTPEQQNWVIMQRLLIVIKPDLSNVEPKGKFTKKVFRIINHTRFELFIMTIIILNIVVMGLSYEMSSDEYTDVLNYVNWGFSGIFLGEMILKHLGYGFRRYWAGSWNKFDAFVVAASIFDILTTLLQQSFFSFIRFGPQLARIFRVLRVSRLFKLVKSFQGLQKMLQTLVFTLPSLLNVGALLFLVYFIYAVLATYIFQNIDGGQIIDSQYVHFMNFFTAIITLFRCSTGENWYIVMFDTINPTSCLPGNYPCGTWAAYPFWLSFIVVCKYIFINLFVLVILQQFEEYHLNDDNPMNTFLTVMDYHITPAWEEFALKHGGTHIHISQLTDFFTRIPAPYGFKGSSLTRIEMSKTLMQLDIPFDFDNMFYYNDIIFAVFRFGFQNKLTEEPNKDQSTYLNMHEEKTITKLNALKKTAIVPGLSRRTTIRQQTKIKKAGASANPIVRILFMGMTMKAWTNYTHAVIEKMKAAKENGVEYVESDSEEDDYTFIDPDASDSDSQKESSLNIKEEEGESDNDERVDTEQESLVDIENNERKSKQDGDETLNPYNMANMALRGKYQRVQKNQGTKITITSHSSIKGASNVELDKKPSVSITSPQKLVKFVEGSDAADIPPQGYSFLDQEFSPKKFDSKKGSKANVEDGEKPSVINVNIQNNVIINNNYFVANSTSENGELGGALSPIGTSVTIERNININRVQSQQQPGRFARRPISGSGRELSLNDTLTVPHSKGTPVSKKSDESMEGKL